MEGSIRAALERACEPGPPRLEVLGPPARIPERPAAVGLVPGSFDPMTVAHAALAEALRRGGARPVLLVYAARTLPKEGRSAAESPLLPPERRLASLVAFSRARPGMGVAVASHGLYVDQATAAAAAYPGASIVVGMGSDKLAQLLDPGWYEDRDATLERLFAVAEVRVCVRAGDDERAAALVREAGARGWPVRRLELASPVATVASSTVRGAIRSGRDARELVPPEVAPFLPDPDAAPGVG